MTGSHLSTYGLARTFGATAAVASVSFTVRPGATLVLLGESGCGKTTTLKMINRLIEPTSGRVEIDGADIRDTPPHILRRHIGYVRQEGGLFPHLTVADNVGVVPELVGMSPKNIARHVDEALDRSGLDPAAFRQRMPSDLSGGEGQRVAIARAIAAEPPLLLMDEPYSALDPITRRAVRNTVAERIRQLGITTVVVTHDVAEAVELADQICLMEAGTVLQVGSPEDLLFRPASAAVRSFFDVHRFETELRVLTVGTVLQNESAATGTAPGKEADDLPRCTLDESLYDAIDRCRRCGEERWITSDGSRDRIITIAEAVSFAGRVAGPGGDDEA
jgi:osmoprotectant transport system ATP-binding protein